MNSYLLQRESGGSVDAYQFNVGLTMVEVLHVEDGEYRSEQYLDQATAYGLWKSLRSFQYTGSGSQPSFVPDAPEAIVAATDHGCRALVFGALATVGFWSLVAVSLGLILS